VQVNTVNQFNELHVIIDLRRTSSCHHKRKRKEL